MEMSTPSMKMLLTASSLLTAATLLNLAHRLSEYCIKVRVAGQAHPIIDDSLSEISG